MRREAPIGDEVRKERRATSPRCEARRSRRREQGITDHESRLTTARE